MKKKTKSSKGGIPLTVVVYDENGQEEPFQNLIAADINLLQRESPALPKGPPRRALSMLIHRIVEYESLRTTGKVQRWTYFTATTETLKRLREILQKRSQDCQQNIDKLRRRGEFAKADHAESFRNGIAAAICIIDQLK